MQRSRLESGFTLIEVMVAIVVLSLGLIAFNIMQVQTVRGNADGIGISSMTWIGTDFVENIIREDYTTIANRDGNGTNDDLAGLDDGLPDAVGSKTSATTPDFSDTAAFDGFEVRYNVAEDQPVNGVITIRLIILRDSDGKRVVLDYFKSNLG